jgi:glucose/arabinose dehydrogenase
LAPGMKWGGLACALIAAVFASGASAQANLEKKKQLRVATADPASPSVPQTGKNAETIRNNLKKVRLPPGFEIDLYAIVPDARHMAVAPSTNMLFVGTRKTTVWAVADRNGEGIAEVRPFAPSLNFKQPNGVCWTKDGSLIVVENNRVLNFPSAASLHDGQDVMVIEVVPQGGLVPVDEESFNHGARTCRVADDGKLYITLGQPYNVQPKEKIALYEKLGIGGVIRMNPVDGTGREVFARGMRNSVGIAVNPNDKTIWATDNQTDGMGDDTPPGELNRLIRVGAHYGYPWYCGRTRVTDAVAGYKLSEIPPPPDIVWPEVEYAAHTAALGLTFYRGTRFPPKYRGGIFVAEHGSWNRTIPIGYRIMFTSLKPDGTADKTEIFADGFRDNAAGITLGRPVDVAELKDGSLLVSDDFAGAIYRIRYTGD